MKQNNLSVLFFLKKDKTNKQGTCPIYCRITYLKRRKQFSTGEFINPFEWNAKKQKASSKSIANQQINLQLEIISANIKKAYLQLQLSRVEFTAEDILNIYIGKPTVKEVGVIKYFNGFLDKKEKLIGIDIQLATWKKFNYACSQAQDFIKWKFGKNDQPLSKLKLQFLHDFEYYLKTERQQSQVTINKCIQRFRKPIKIAVAEGYLEKDPFALHMPGKVKKEVVFLSTEELDKLEKHVFIQPRLILVKDLFIFCCYTGLAYHEMSSLKREHIVKGFDGNEWIQMKRKKTGKLISVPLLPKAKRILHKYRNTGDFALPKFSNQKINSYLKEIGGIVGINNPISHHMARKTFASTVLLYNGVSMEIVSELLGHSSIKITQEYYGKVVQKRVSKEMRRVSKRTK
ncbi:site-specific integrase [Maribacter luteus]|uniref:Tyrosine-type recombinase/integrase n=1 Tax=Maribacter luteus TaxID=2594478 RepID=A0A6I2MKR3_9FLAO|nr:site-specific integrase [Maribacter luteus]MRX64373.1 tyrosine-type recombinase/integrase [Maribacter luteus]